MKSTYFRLFSISFLVAAILIILFTHAKLPNKIENGFVRKWIADNLKMKSRINIDPQIISIAGISDKQIFLTGSNPKSILVLDINFLKKDTLLLKLSIAEKELIPAKVFVDSNDLYLHCYNSGYLVQGSLSKKGLTKKKLETEVFSKSIQFSRKYLVIRAFKPNSSRQVMQKIDAANGRIMVEKNFETENDFGMATDGFFTFDRNNNKIIYVHYFLNKLIFLDTNLNQVKVAHTIDTTYNNNVKIGPKNKDGAETQIVPISSRMKVNSIADCYNGKLYILSELRADNESISTFRKNVEIDVYNINTDNYVGSFYLPKYKSKRINSLKVSKIGIVALYEGEIQCYELPRFLL